MDHSWQSLLLFFIPAACYIKIRQERGFDKRSIVHEMKVMVLLVQPIRKLHRAAKVASNLCCR